jgi:hypothetical protein
MLILLEAVLVKEFNSDTDLGRLAELWGNLCMIQQMRGGSHWMEKYQKSGLTWSDYLTKLTSLPESKALVFIMKEVVFGFTFFTIEKDLATIREFYLEPGYKDKLNTDLVIEDIKSQLRNQGVQFIEFDIKDLPI